MRTDYERIKEAIPNLGPDERADLLIRLQNLTRPKQSVETSVDMSVYEQLAHYVLGRGVCVPPHSVAVKHARYKQFKAGAEVVSRYIDEQFSTANRVRRIYVLRFILGLAVRRVLEMRLPVSMVTIGDALVNTGSLVEDALPGYVRSGMLQMIFDRTPLENANGGKPVGDDARGACGVASVRRKGRRDHSRAASGRNI